MNIKKSSLTRNYIYNLLNQIINVVVPILMTPYISRVLGANGIGIFSYTNSIVSYFVLIATLGLDVYGQREIAYVGENIERRTAVFWKIISVKAVSVFITIIFYLNFIELVGSNRIYLMIQILFIIEVLFNINWFFAGMQLFEVPVKRNAFIKVLSCIGVLLFVKSEEYLSRYIFIMSGMSLIGNISIWLYVPQYLGKICIENIKKIRVLKAGLQLYAAYAATQIYTIFDKTMIGLITKSALENAYYEQAQKIIHTSLSLITVLGTSLMPKMSEISSQKEEFERIMNKVLQAVVLIAFPMSCGVVAVSDWLVPWFLGNEFKKAVLLLKICSALILTIGISHIIVYGILIPLGQQNKFMISTVAGAISNIFLNYFLISKYGSIGAAVASIIAEIIVTLITLYYAQNYYNKRLLIKNIIEYGFRAICMGVIVYIAGYFFNYINVPYIIITFFQIALGIGIYFLMLVQKQDEMIKTVFKMLGRIKKGKSK